MFHERQITSQSNANNYVHFWDDKAFTIEKGMYYYCTTGYLFVFFVMKCYAMIWSAYLYPHLLAHHESCGTEKHITSHIRPWNSIFHGKPKVLSNGGRGRGVQTIEITKLVNGMWRKKKKKKLFMRKIIENVRKKRAGNDHILPPRSGFFLVFALPGKKYNAYKTEIN